ncbi:DNA helicase/exodeoxyribonuclease V subunit B [Natranaerovirga pectinivora]|uniref:ATP-dependent helicase/deoxyribonuclease subunit B n=1 Tax=Natranaerovirga pectinivora TaxID=682400 RepID=A0A4R3MPY3_9FIRM|nr:helicase-exonuclease AddAB subunit AddB [Natranaerovirga pectinivora]TCT14335.1 DNA helicase/exodeoxyribonuclease V subunit B [Natranaerovirga pectinivora]
MGLSFIMGRSGSGKTHICYEEIIKKSEENSKETFILLVPEQFTLQTQKDIVSKHPKKGIMSIEVLSFQRLAFRVFDELGGTTKKILEETGKSMVVRKVLEEQKSGLKIFNKNMDKIGVVNELKSAITEFYQYNLSEIDIEDIIEKANKSPLLQMKLQDLYLIFKGFKNFLEDNYITNEELLDILKDVIIRSNFIKNCSIWIDGFTGFTPIQYKVLKELIANSNEVKVTITIDPMESMNHLDKYQLFYESKKTYNNLIQIAKELNIKSEELIIEEEIPIRFANQKALAHLEKHLFRFPYDIYKEEPMGMEVFIADDLDKEVEFVARKITDLTRYEGYKYRDIAIITGDIQRYDLFIKKIFANYKIPYFIDQKKNILSNPLVELIRTSFDVINNYWSYESVFSWFKTGLCNIEKRQLDLIENYAIAYGIKGRKNWEKVWDKPYPSKAIEKDKAFELEEMNQIKEKVIQPLIDFQDKIKGKGHKVKAITVALYEFLRKLKIQEKLEYYANEFNERELLLLERQYNQIYKIVIDLLDKTVEILGEEVVSVKEYSKILQAGLEQSQMGLVPPGLDQVVIGDIERTRLKDVKTLFLIGANDGVIPKTSDKGNVLNDMDRELIEESGITIAPTAKQKSYEEQFNLYLNLTKPQDHLFISFSKLNGEYKTIRPSNLVNQVMKLYPKLKLSFEEKKDGLEYIGLPESTLKYLIEELRQYKVKELGPTWETVYNWYFNSEQWKERIIKLIEGMFFENKEFYLSKETSDKLYNKVLNNSVSRLEQFLGCPFSHFIKYGLKAQERIKYEVSMPDIGILFHDSIEAFSKKLIASDLDWRDISEELRDQLVEEVVREVASNYGNQVFFSSAKNEYLIQRVIRITKRTVWALQNHIKSGKFKPTDYEVSFNTDKEKLEELNIKLSDEHVLQLTGRIDRIDKYEEDDKIYLKVLDYKSGKSSFDIVALYYGLQLQLMVYLNVATTLEKSKHPNKEVIPAGVFYYHIDDPLLSVEKNLSDDEREDELLKELKMNGLVLENEEVIKLLDSSFETQSNIIPVKYKANGELAANSSVASKEQFERVLDFVSEKIKNAGEDLINGNVGIKPYRYKKKTACDYCSYKSICQFDPSLEGDGFEVLKEMSRDEVWKLIEGDKNPDERDL